MKTTVAVAVATGVLVASISLGFATAHRMGLITPTPDKPAVVEDAKPKQINVEKTWEGEVKMELRNIAPKSGFITDREEWSKLWQAYRGAENVPDVDFERELILVAVGSDPNRLWVDSGDFRGGLRLDENGDLKVSVWRTARWYKDPTICAYLFVLIKRQGIKSIDGRSITRE